MSAIAARSLLTEIKNDELVLPKMRAIDQVRQLGRFFCRGSSFFGEASDGFDLFPFSSQSSVSS